MLLISSLGLAGTMAAPAPTEDREIREHLASPSISLDEEHPGPKMVPEGLPAGVFPLDCPAARAFLHRVRPGQYHFERAQRLVGGGTDMHGCEVLGLDRFDDPKEPWRKGEQAVKEAEAAAAAPRGLELWMPGALRWVAETAYRQAAASHRKLGPEHRARARQLLARARTIRREPGKYDPDPASWKRTPLMDAVSRGDAAAVVALLDSGAPIDAEDTDHTSALRLAVVNGREDILRVLLDRGAAPDVPDEEGVTALQDACSMGRLAEARLLLDAGARVNARAEDGSSALLAAVRFFAVVPRRADRVALVRLLLARGAEVNAADWRGVTPLFAALPSHDSELVAVLRAAGATSSP